MGKIIAVGNLKGGTGKSTTAVNLACALARPERPVLLVDADAQATASDWLGEGPPAVDVLPLPLMVARDAEPWVARVMELHATYDVLVIDLPPQVGSGIASALLLADLFLVPVTPSGADLRATGKALDLLQRARATRGGERPACVLIPSKVDRRSAIGRRVVASLDRFGLKIGPTIRQRSAHIEAFDAGQWVGANAPNTAAHAEVRALAAFVERLLGLDRAQRPDKPEPRPVRDPAANVVAAAGAWATPTPAVEARAGDAAPVPAAEVVEDDAGGPDAMRADDAAGADNAGARGALDAGGAVGEDARAGGEDGTPWSVNFGALDADGEAEDAGAGVVDEDTDPLALGDAAAGSGARTGPDGEDGALWGMGFDARDGDAGAEEAGADAMDDDLDPLAFGDDVADTGDGGARPGGAEPGGPIPGNGVAAGAGLGSGNPDRSAVTGEHGSQGRGMWGPAAGDGPDAFDPGAGHPLRPTAEPEGTAPVEGEGEAEDLEADGMATREERDPDAKAERRRPAEATEPAGWHKGSEPARPASTAASMSPLARLRHAFWSGRG